MDVSENDRPAIVKSLTLEEHNSLSQSNSQFEKKKMEVHDESSGDSYDEKLNVFVSASTEVHEEAVREDLNNSKDDRCETGTGEENMNATEIKSEPLSPSVKVKEEPVNENDNEETETDEDERDRLAADQESSVLRHILGNQPVDSEPTNVPHPVFMVRSEELKNTIKKEPGSVEDVPQSSNGLSESIYLRIPIQGLKAPWKMAGGKRAKHDVAVIEKAVEAVRSNSMGLRKAAKHFGIAVSTLADKVKGKTAIQVVPRTLLTATEEEKLVKWLQRMSELGFGQNPDDIRGKAKAILELRGGTTKDLCNMPSTAWVYRFLERHPELTLRMPMSLGKERTLGTSWNVKKWFSGLFKYVTEKDSSLLGDPTRIFNSDESGFSFDPKERKVIACEGAKSVYNVTSDTKTQVTVLATMSAAGFYLPPLLIYPYKRIPGKNLLDGFPEAVLQVSDNGWITSAIFYTWLRDNFIPATQHIKKPLLLLVDSHVSHTSLIETSEICEDNEIILYCLMPHVSHLIQPLDQAFFASVKSGWSAASRRHVANTGDAVSLDTFAKVLKPVWESSATKVNAESSYRAAGIVPFSPERVLQTKKMQPCQASSKESLRSSKNFEESRKRRKSPWRKPLERASCLVCNAPCIITVNRKILSLPFCKRCKKSYFYQMSARLHKGGACGRTECSLQGNCTIDYRLKKRCPACLRQKFDLILKQGQSHFKERLGPFDPFSEENINRYRWGKTQTVRSTLSKEASTKEYPKSLTKSAISSRMRRRRHKEAKLMAEALTNVPRVVLRRCDEIQSSSGVYGTNDNSKSPVTVHRTSHDLSSSKMFLKPRESLPPENGYKTVVKGEPANPVEEEFVGVQKEEPVEEIVDEPVNLVKQEQDSDHLVVEENPGEAILNHDTGIRSERKSPCHVPPAPQMAPATSGEFANLHSKILKYGTILSQLQTFTNSPSEMETDTRPKAAGTIMFDTNHIQPPTAIYQAKSTEESKNLLSHVKNKLSERLNFMTSTKIMKGVPKRSKTIKVCVFSCGHACNTCNSPSSTKWLQSTGYQCADPLQQSASKKQLGRPSGPVAERSSEEPGIVLDLNIINKLIQQRNLVIDHASGTVCLPKSLQKSNKVTYNMKAPETVSFVNYSGVIDLTKNHEQVSQPKPDPVVNPASLIIPAPPIYYSQAPNSTPRQTLVPSQVAQTGSQGNNLTWAVTPVTPGPSSNSLCNQLLSRGTVINVPQSVIQANANVPQLQPFALSGGLNSTIPQSVVRVNPDGSMVIPLSYNSFNKPTQLNIPVAPPVTSIPLGTSAPCSSNYIYMPKTGLIEPTVKKGLQNKKIKKSN